MGPSMTSKPQYPSVPETASKLAERYTSKQSHVIHSSSKVRQLFETMHRCSSFDLGTYKTKCLQYYTKHVQVESLFVGLILFSVLSVLRMHETGHRPREKRARSVLKKKIFKSPAKLFLAHERHK